MLLLAAVAARYTLSSSVWLTSCFPYCKHKHFAPHSFLFYVHRKQSHHTHQSTPQWVAVPARKPKKGRRWRGRHRPGEAHQRKAKHSQTSTKEVLQLEVRRLRRIRPRRRNHQIQRIRWFSLTLRLEVSIPFSVTSPPSPRNALEETNLIQIPPC